MTACGGHFAATCFEHTIANISKSCYSNSGNSIKRKPLLAINHHFCKIWMLFGYDILRFLLLNSLSEIFELLSRLVSGAECSLAALEVL